MINRSNTLMIDLLQASLLCSVPILISAYALSTEELIFIEVFDLSGSIGALSVAIFLAILSPLKDPHDRPIDKFIWGLSLSHIFIFLVCVSATVHLANRPNDIGPIIAYSICGYILSVIFFLLAINYERVQQTTDSSLQFEAHHSFLICSGTILSSSIFPVLFIYTLSPDANLPLFNPIALVEVLDIQLIPNINIFSVSLMSVAGFWFASVLLLKKNQIGHDLNFFIDIFLAIYAINSNFFIIFWVFTAQNLSKFLEGCWSNALTFIFIYIVCFVAPKIKMAFKFSANWGTIFYKAIFAFFIGSVGYFSFKSIVPSSVMLFPLVGLALMAGFLAYVARLELQIQKRTAEINLEREKSDALLANILPKYVINDLKHKGFSEPRSLKNISVMFTDFVGFTTISQQISASKLISELNEIFTEFDKITENFASERIKTIGDAYMCVSGLQNSEQSPQQNLAEIALQMIKFLQTRNLSNDIQWELRIGIASGDSVGGIVGKTKYLFDLFGDAVNTAARMESYSEPQSINIDEKTYLILCENPRFHFAKRPVTFVKGKGNMQMYFVTEAEKNV